MGKAPLVQQPFLDWYSIWPGLAGRDEHGRSWHADAPRGTVCACSLRTSQRSSSDGNVPGNSIGSAIRS